MRRRTKTEISLSKRMNEIARARSELRARLEAGHLEIEQGILARARAIADPAEVADPAYAEGLRAAVGAAIDYALDLLETGEELAPPPLLLAQARLAARSGIGLDVVLRRCFAGYTLIGEHLDAQAERSDERDEALAGLLPGRAAVFDRLVAAVCKEHAEEEKRRLGSPERRRTESVRRLLAGERVGVADIPYDLDAHHLGLVAVGNSAADVMRTTAASLDCRLLLVRADEQTAWAWLGGRARIHPQRVIDCLRLGDGELPVFAVGEPGTGLAGWRLSHCQARAALSVALRTTRRTVRYADVALLSSALRDDVLTDSLRKLYLEPIERDGGDVLCEALNAYFASERNISSAAAVLGISRNTLASRLRTVEAIIGDGIADRAPELEAALRLRSIGPPVCVAQLGDLAQRAQY